MSRTQLISIVLTSAYLLNACGGASGSSGSTTALAPQIQPLAITSGAPPNGTVQNAYGSNGKGFSLAASGGTAPYNWGWAASSGSLLPPGLAVSSAGLISGTPTTAGTYSTIVTVKDSGSPGAQASADYMITISSASQSSLAITSGPLSDGMVGTAYGQLYSVKSLQGPILHATYFQLTATGGTGSISWSWAAAPGSSLPPGLSCCNLVLGSQFPPIRADVPDAIYGVPAAPGTFHVVVTVTDSASPPAQASTTWAVAISPPPPPVINATSPAIGTLNSPYVGFTFTATEGLPPFTWSETGALPTGMQFNPTGVLSGTPTIAGSFLITVMANDSVGQDSIPTEFTIQVLAKGFVPTGSMESPRAGHTATLLNTGKVLVAGGSSTGGPGLLATAELFDPTSGTFTATGSMGMARVSHTATLLADGRVLITGGTDSAGIILSSAEIFDSAKGTFSPTGSMEIGRLFNTATLLNTGKVLVAGGLEVTGAFLVTAELFDPTTGMFTPTGSMATARAGHTATLLSDGRVLVAGGDTATAEIFDPSTGTFTPTGSLEAARVNHTATLLKSGKVLLTGGQDNGSAALASAEVFDLTLGTFTPTGNMETVRASHTAVLLNDGTVLVAGGVDSSTGLSFSSAELFDPTAGTFSPTADMTTQRQSHAAILLSDGEMLVTGGQNSEGYLSSAELYQ